MNGGYWFESFAPLYLMMQFYLQPIWRGGILALVENAGDLVMFY